MRKAKNIDEAIMHLTNGGLLVTAGKPNIALGSGNPSDDLKFYRAASREEAVNILNVVAYQNACGMVNVYLAEFSMVK